MILVTVDPKNGILRRYVKDSGSAFARLTHRYRTRVSPCLFAQNCIDEFYTEPADCERISSDAYTPAFDYKPCA